MFYPNVSKHYHVNVYRVRIVSAGIFRVVGTKKDRGTVLVYKREILKTFFTPTSAAYKKLPPKRTLREVNKIQM